MASRNGLNLGLVLGRKTLRPLLGQLPKMVLVDIGELQLTELEPEPIVGVELPGKGEIGRTDAERTGRRLGPPAAMIDHDGGNSGALLNAKR